MIKRRQTEHMEINAQLWTALLFRKVEKNLWKLGLEWHACNNLSHVRV